MRLLRSRATELWPSLRVLAQDVLAAETSIDWVAVDPDGCAVAVLVGEAGEDLGLVARALAHRAWLAPRLGSWLQLAPHSGLRPEAGARALLLCPSFRSEALAAARALDGAIALAAYRCLRDGAGLTALLEPVQEPSAGPAQALPGQSRATSGAIRERFRSQLTDRDLGLGSGDSEPRGEFFTDNSRHRADNF